jgi:transcriptional antiterminator RfaH
MALDAACLEVRNWYLAQLKPGGLARATENLRRQGFHTFMPHRPATRRHGTRLFAARRPLFPGYLFVKVEPGTHPWRTLNATFGVSRMVGFGAEGPRAVPEALVAGLMARTDAGGEWRAADDLAVGAVVRIVAGPFADTLARIDAIPEAGRIHALLEMMGRTVRAEFAPRDLQRL